MGQYLGNIREIRDETYDVKTFRLQLGVKISFIPGQYCLVNLLGEKKPFTFANSPSHDVELTVKKMGAFTSAMHQLKIGDSLNLEGPYGKSLNFDESIHDDIVFLAGGSGITPFMSAIRYAAEKKLPNRITLFFSNRTYEDIIYREELKSLKENGAIKLIHILTREKPAGFDAETGRINIDTIKKHIQMPQEKLWYICCPPQMVASMRDILKSIGVPESRIKWEDWQIPGKHDEKTP